MTTEIKKAEVVEILKGARTVDFTTSVLETKKKLDMVREDSRNGDKAAKAYEESVSFQYRMQLKFLYEAAQTAFPEDEEIIPGHAMSSLGPEKILERYDFKVIVAKK
jgi:hypothetical protein